MGNFLVYDLTFLVLFTIFTFYFLRKNKKSLAKEGIIYMYRTQAGVKAINKFSDKYKNILHAIKHFVVGLGAVLMAAMLWMLGQTLWLYIKYPEITQNIKAPPIAPLIPYFPRLFGLSSVFPPFYFTYFIVAIAIVAIVHEFSHGIFMRLFKVKIKSTGLVFLGPILGAFVEEKKSNFEKKKNSEQMTILAAGVFANSLFAFIFYLLYVAFFFTAFTASGYIFTNYGLDSVPLDQVTGFEESGNLTKVLTTNGTFYLDKSLEIQRNQSGLTNLVAFPESPAVLSQIRGAIIQGDNVKIINQIGLQKFLQTKEPGDNVTIMTQTLAGIETYDITLASHPLDSSKAYLGVGHQKSEPKGFIQKFLSKFMSFRDRSTYYVPNWDSDLIFFIFHFLWWIMVINLLVALFNMMPLGMLDGGRFFYLAVLSITGSEKVAQRTYTWMGYAIAAAFALMMFYWALGFF